jgi:hypothetical protein
MVIKRNKPKPPRRLRPKRRRQLVALAAIFTVVFILFVLARLPAPQLGETLQRNIDTLYDLDYDWLVIDAELGNIIGEI